MFTLDHIDLSHGICRYKTETNEKIVINWTNKGFKAKLRFPKNYIQCTTVSLEIPIPEIANVAFSISSKDPSVNLNDSHVQEVIEAFQEILTKWSSLLMDREFYKTDHHILRFLYPEYSEYSDDEINEMKLFKLAQYEELQALFLD